MKGPPEIQKMFADILVKAEQLRKEESAGGGPIDRDPPLPPSGGGGTPSGMEARLAKLEAQMDHVQADLAKLSGLPVAMAEIKTRLDALPDKDWVGAKMRNWVGGGVAFLTLVTIAAKFVHLG